MRTLNTVVWISAVLLAVAGIGVDGIAGQDETSASSAGKQRPPVSANRPSVPRVVYKPPTMGKPAKTVGGGSRGDGEVMPRLFVMAPNHVGQTTSGQPSLFWYIDRVPDAGWRLEFTLLDEGGVAPRVERALPTPERAGLHRIRLADFDATLDPGREYQWSVALIRNPDDRSKDVAATAWIDRVESAQISPRLDGQDGSRAAAIYAEAGIFYDALAALCDAIDLDPANAELREQRSALLRQVGLEVTAGGREGEQPGG